MFAAGAALAVGVAALDAGADDDVEEGEVGAECSQATMSKKQETDNKFRLVIRSPS